MEIFFIVLFLVMGVALFIAEIFLFPGISICGVAGAVFIGAAIWYAFSALGTTAGVVTIATAILIFAVAICIFLRTRTLDKMSLKTQLDGGVDRPFSDSQISVGDRGVTQSRLAPRGTILINGIEVEAKGVEGFIDSNCKVEVVAVDGITVKVKALND